MAVDALTVRRRRHGKGWVYLDGRGRPIRDQNTLARIRALGIPPAYQDVRIAPDERAHVQAVGRDAQGRLQYLYHPDWQRVRDHRKVEHLAALAAALPRLRRRVAADLRRPAADRRKALAAVVALIDRTHIRVGCEGYVHTGRSRGAATLLKRHVSIEGSRVTLNFPGKRRQPVACGITAPALASALGELARLPGSRLFQYRDGAGRVHRVTAGEVNAYLQDIVRAPVTAKDFRTLAATATAAQRLAAIEPAASESARNRQLAPVMREVAQLLANTPAVVRKSYVHSRLVSVFLDGDLAARWDGCAADRWRSRGEALVAALFQASPAAAAQAGLRPPGMGGGRASHTGSKIGGSSQDAAK